jgi:hypothetical protein
MVNATATAASGTASATNGRTSAEDLMLPTSALVFGMVIKRPLVNDSVHFGEVNDS